MCENNFFINCWHISLAQNFVWLKHLYASCLNCSVIACCGIVHVIKEKVIMQHLPIWSFPLRSSFKRYYLLYYVLTNLHVYCGVIGVTMQLIFNYSLTDITKLNFCSNSHNFYTFLMHFCVPVSLKLCPRRLFDVPDETTT